MEVTKEVIETADPSPSQTHNHQKQGLGVGDGSVRYGLLLHGTCPLPSVCMSTCSVTPEWTLSGKQRQEAELQEQQELQQGLGGRESPMYHGRLLHIVVSASMKVFLE